MLRGWQVIVMFFGGPIAVALRLRFNARKRHLVPSKTALECAEAPS